MAQEAYPRPQLERRNWTPLNGRWRFAFDDERSFQCPEDVAQWPLEITVPFPPESEASGIGDRGFHSTCWYQRDFYLKPGKKRYFLHFGAVDYYAKVWVNGQLAVTHEGGHTPFHADMTHLLREDGGQMLTVYVEDDPHDLAKPRGKQDWQLEPHVIWYPRTTGIWQTVWWEEVPRTYVDKIRWTPSMEGFEIGFEAIVGGDAIKDLSVEVMLTVGKRLLVHDHYQIIDSAVARRISLPDPGIDDYRNELLWSPERPTLIDVVLKLKHGDHVLDELKSYTALRSINILRDRFMLNHRPYMLRMVLDQGYWPDTLLACPSDDALRRDVELTKAMGFNCVRKHQKIENPRYLYWADKLGLMVWEEMPSPYRFDRVAIQRLIREWTEAIERDYSHPSVVVWVPFNESWGVPDLPLTKAQRHAVEALYHLTKTLDPTRPVVGNDGWESSATDIIGIHDYDANIDHLRTRYGSEIHREELFDRRRPGGRILTLDGYPHRGQPIMLTECGGIAYAKCAQEGADQAWGYSAVTNDEDFHYRYHQLMELLNTTAMFSGFCYTQFADTFQESNGLLCADRTPKIPLQRIARATTIPRTHIQGGV